MNYTAVPLSSDSILMIDAQTGSQKGEQRVVDNGGTILNVSASNNIAAVTYMRRDGSTHMVLVDLPGGRMHGGQQLTPSTNMKPKRTPTHAIKANNANITALDNGKRYQGESGSGLIFALIGLYIGWCCVKALTIWAWGQVLYSYHWWMH